MIFDSSSTGLKKQTISQLQTRKLRIAFVHPDLGIGGAERLVVDTAIGLKNLGHSVQIFTSSFDPNRAFKETVDQSLSVQVLGDRLFPRSINNRFITICAILRQVHLSFSLIFSFLLGSRQPFDVYFVDQLSASIPILRYATRTRLLFYCHFPDLLLSSIKPAEAQSWLGRLKAIYRIPLDRLEEYTTGQADSILVNSQFTDGVFRKTMPSIVKPTKCVYPGVDIKFYDRSTHQTDHTTTIKPPIHSTRPTILSINRFEEKKDLKLLILAFIQLRKRMSSTETKNHSTLPRLVLAGGYDERLVDNRRTLEALQDIIPSELTQRTVTNEETGEQDSHDVLFLLNVPQDQKLALLNADSTKLLAYTASNEHLGIGPLEGMACRLPVLAVDSGGPKETVIDGKTGFLFPPDPARWSEAIERILSMNDDERQMMGKAGRERVMTMFSTEVMAKQIEEALLELVQPGRFPDIWLEPGFFYLLGIVVLPLMAVLMCAWKWS